jgi:hypothetical protein
MGLLESSWLFLLEEGIDLKKWNDLFMALMLFYGKAEIRNCVLPPFSNLFPLSYVT